MKSVNEKLINGLAGGLFALFVIYCVFFVLTNGNIVRNRFTDSWWRIALADEYSQTGVFAKDPFFADAPPFAGTTFEQIVNVGRDGGWKVDAENADIIVLTPKDGEGRSNIQ